MKRALVVNASLGKITIAGDVFHHLAHVLRVQIEEEIEVFDGQGQTLLARVQHIGEASMELFAAQVRTDVIGRKVTIIQGLPKGEKLEFVLQKGTELGASAFIVCEMERSIAKIKEPEKKVERWNRIVEEAARQCGRNTVPTVQILSLESCVRNGEQLLILDEEQKTQRFSKAVAALPATQPISILIGPEGGLSRSEVQFLEARTGISTTLGTSILRTETAALAALSIVRYLDGSLG
jgi:16S rRNA (uracil1498-N3)-methyltransferase